MGGRSGEREDLGDRPGSTPDDSDGQEASVGPRPEGDSGISGPALGGNDRGDRKELGDAHAIKRAMQIARSKFPEFMPDPDAADFVVKTLAPADYERAIEMDRAKSQTPPPSEWFLEALRVTGREIDWWAMDMVSHLALDDLKGKPPSSMKSIAHRMGLTESELEHLAERATGDSVALLVMCLPAHFIKDLQISVTPSVMERSGQLLREMRSLGMRS